MLFRNRTSQNFITYSAQLFPGPCAIHIISEISAVFVFIFRLFLAHGQPGCGLTSTKKSVSLFLQFFAIFIISYDISLLRNYSLTLICLTFAYMHEPSLVQYICMSYTRAYSQLLPNIAINVAFKPSAHICLVIRKFHTTNSHAMSFFSALSRCVRGAEPQHHQPTTPRWPG